MVATSELGRMSSSGEQLANQAQECATFSPSTIDDGSALVRMKPLPLANLGEEYLPPAAQDIVTTSTSKPAFAAVTDEV